MSVVIYKEVGETPLEALERYRAGRPELAGLPMTYAGRLDPMAEGQLLILIGEECKNKEKYLGLDKEYEVEMVFGIETDTYDALGLVTNAVKADVEGVGIAAIGVLNQKSVSKFFFDTKKSSKMHDDWEVYVGKLHQEYPPYSSKTFNGKQLHALARAGELPDEMPTKDVEIYSIESLGDGSITATDLKARIFNMIDKVKGDFRQDEIKKRWGEVLKVDASYSFVRIRVQCSSGTYMRSLAHKIGKDTKTGAIALTIKRIKIEL